jgi:hypothetical protein
MVKGSAVTLLAYGRQKSHQVSTARIVQHNAWLVALSTADMSPRFTLRATLMLSLTSLL